MTGSLELLEESRLEFSTVMVVRLVTFENLVQALENERPETMQGAKVEHEFESMCRVMVIWTNDRWTIQLV